MNLVLSSCVCLPVLSDGYIGFPKEIKKVPGTFPKKSLGTKFSKRYVANVNKKCRFLKKSV